MAPTVLFVDPPDPPGALRAEIGRTARLALPLVLGQLSAVAMNFVDTMLAGHHGAQSLAAVTVGSAVWSVVILVLVGVLMAVPPSVAQLVGAGRREAIGPLYRQALWLALGLGLLLWLAVGQSRWLLAAMAIDASVRPLAAAYLDVLRYGAPALALFFASRYLSEGTGWTWPTLVAGLGGVALLAPVGYVLMHGIGSWPGRGVPGLAEATVLVLWLQALGLMAYLRLAPRFRDLDLFAHWQPPHPRELAQLLKLGLPIGVAVFMEGSLFVATALLIGRLGAVAVAAHGIAINVSSLAFMLPLGVAMATTVRIGTAAGAGDGASVRRIGLAGYVIVLGTQVLAAAVMVFGGVWIAAAYSDDAAVVALGATLLLYAAAFQFPDGIQALSAGALRGLKDTTWPMAITLVAYWGIGMPVGAWFGLARHGGAPGMWAGLIAGLSVAAWLLGWRFHRLSRRWGEQGDSTGRDAAGA